MCCSGWREFFHSLSGALPKNGSTRATGGAFALLFLGPDISLLGYLRSASKSSAGFYNAVHSYVLPLALGLLAWHLRSFLTGQLVLIWLSHISFDRCIGYGLKFSEVFRYTHIQSSATIEQRPFPSEL